MLFELRRLYGDLSHHIKECHNGTYCLNFLEKKKCSVHIHTEPKYLYQKNSVRIRVPLHP